MNKHDRAEVNKLIHSIGLMNNLTDAQTKEIVESQFKAIRSVIDNTDIDNVSSEDLDNIESNCIVRHIGKIFTNRSKIETIRRRNKK